jgi:hypothetical protein
VEERFEHSGRVCGEMDGGTVSKGIFQKVIIRLWWFGMIEPIAVTTVALSY